MKAARILLAAVWSLCGGVATAQDANSPSTWKVEEKIDKLDASRSVILYVPSSDTLTANGRKTTTATLAFRCGHGQTDIAIQWPVYLGSGGYGSVKWRVDAAAIVAEQWPLDAANRFLLRNSQGIKYAKHFFGKKELLFSAQPWLEGQTLTFPIAGIEAAIKPIRELCNW